ncbi:heme ABC transporter ATP-binding protein [Paenibacillus ginsengarvi]|uniref:Heme ABC transporter ATP-binding protein n=1 Tax=Paenibacillus ginsengarvi TaxID=400777 RepID=A0A3B0BKT3_9BACL|nr:heme ABC transporter ATP-binding protein [Paenibacillus ginsengarvi]RKN72951.1 heme ABC transporter ATP-binding protein [Paenibacillus ginsengarvi]
MIEVSGLSKSFDAKSVLNEISFSASEGETLGIIGPNGSGKSTLLKMLSGVEHADSGDIRLGGKPIRAYPRKELAKWLAVLQQDALPPVGFTVREVLEMGRYPFQNWLGDEPEDSSGLIDDILAELRLTPFAERTLEHLSGGERQRVALGKVMAQQPRLLLLDEPTTYLDIGYQMQMMDTVRRWQEEQKLTVVAVLHDLNLAAQYCDRLLLIHRGRIARLGTPWEVLDRELILEVYETEPIVTAHPVTGAPQLLLQPGAALSLREEAVSLAEKANV